MAEAGRVMASTDGLSPDGILGPARGKATERKILTAMFVDIVGSSALVAGRDPEDADHALLSILNRLIDAVPRYGGMVSQLLGDGFLAVFGAPDAKEDHALRACLAAQDIICATADTDRPDFRIRIGISSGEVVAHIVESGVWADYRAVGECVHLAAKLQQRADPNSAQLSQDTLDLIPVGVAARPVGSLTLAKGAAPMPAFTLEGARAVRRTATDLLRSSDAPFVGRETEVATLFAMADRAEAGTASLLVLRGEAGIGKSRLVGEFLRDARSRRWNVVQWAQMPIRRLGDPDDLEAVALSLAVQLTGTAIGEGPLRIVAAAERRAGSLAADAVRALFGLAATDPLWSGLDPAQRLNLSIEGVIGAILELASHQVADRRPMLILVEDAHWARPVMARLLDSLVAALPSSRASVFLLATMRPPALRLESAPEGWNIPKNAHRIDLSTLDNEQVDIFLNHWLGLDWSLDNLKSLVAERSQGVPFYLEEILRTLEANGVLSGAPGTYRLTDSATLLNLPRSLHGLLAARMDLLDSEPRRVLMNAAVIGPTFDIGLLRSLNVTSSLGLSVHLAYLERAGFILRTRLLPNLEYMFNHALIREVAYATLTKADRKDLHARVFKAIRNRGEQDLPNRLSLLAHHAFMAENWPLAYVCGRRAGLHAETRSKLEDATHHYENALKAFEKTSRSQRSISREIDLLIALPRALLPRGGTNVHNYLNLARNLSEKTGDSVRSAQASSILASFFWAYGDLDQAMNLCQKGLLALDHCENREVRVQLLFRLGGVLADKGLFAQALIKLNIGDALIDEKLSKKNCGLSAIATVLTPSIGGRCLAETGQKAKAIAAGIRAVEIAEESGHAFSRIFANTHLGWICLTLNEIERSIPALQTALSLCEVARTPILRPLISGGLGYAQVISGHQEEGFSLFVDSFATFKRQSGEEDRLHPRVFLPQVLLWQAKALKLTGQHQKALITGQRALKAALDTEQLAYEAYANFFLADTEIQDTKRQDHAFKLLRRAHSLAQQLSMTPLVTACQTYLSNVHLN